MARLPSVLYWIWARMRPAPLLPALQDPNVQQPFAVAPRCRILSLGYDERGALSTVLELRDLPKAWSGMLDIEMLGHDGLLDARELALVSAPDATPLPLILRYEAHAIRDVVGWRVAGQSSIADSWTCDARVDEWMVARRVCENAIPVLYSLPEHDELSVVATAKRGVFHRPSCPMAQYARLNQTITSPQEALRKGYRPCQRCLATALRR